MTQTYNLLALSEAVSPITHAKGTSGNESLVMRVPVVTPRGVLWVPSLSGNALRHRLVREPGNRWLIGRLELPGKLSRVQLNYCFHGGNLTEGGGREDTRRIADWQRLFPLGRLLGGSLPAQILSGSSLCWPGTLVCEENRTALSAMLPHGWELPPETLRPAETFVSDYQYTRGDAAKSHVDLMADDDLDGESSSNLMIFSGQAVSRGSIFLHGFTLQHVSELELGALLLSLRLWQEAGGTIGGQSARGHGRLQTLLHVDGVDEAAQEAAGAADGAPVDAAAEECRDWLAAAFAPRSAKPPKGKKAVAAE